MHEEPWRSDRPTRNRREHVELTPAARPLAFVGRADFAPSLTYSAAADSLAITPDAVRFLSPLLVPYFYSQSHIA